LEDVIESEHELPGSKTHELLASSQFQVIQKFSHQLQFCVAKVTSCCQEINR